MNENKMEFRGKTLAELIKNQRRFLKCSQQFLAEKSGLSLSTISKIEQGLITSPDFETARALAVCLGIPIEKVAQIIVDNNLDQE